MFFDARSVNGSPDLTYGASDLAALGNAYFSDGVLSPDALEVETTGQMSVTVAPGAAVICGYTYILDEEKTLSVDASQSERRFDLVVLRLDIGERSISPAIRKGTAVSQAVIPAPINEGGIVELPLALLRVPVGAQSSAECTLEDKREFASIRTLEAPIEAAVGEAISQLDLPDEGELDAIRRINARVTTSGSGAKVLCDDGRYRRAILLDRVEAARYTTAGEYVFKPSEHPSANGLYDVELIGGGGGGASVIGSYKRGGGGGAGAHVTVCSLRLSGEVGVNVGAGGIGGAGFPGVTGGESRFGAIFAGGGEGGSGTSGGLGAETAQFRGADGSDGSTNTQSVTYLDECGAGAPSAFGAGGAGSDNAEVSFGCAGGGFGSGGSGAGGPEALSSLLAGGQGADGAVIVYAYAAPAPEGE